MVEGRGKGGGGGGGGKHVSISFAKKEFLTNCFLLGNTKICCYK